MPEYSLLDDIIDEIICDLTFIKLKSYININKDILENED